MIESVQRRIVESQTRLFKAIFPGDTNHYDTLFGGSALSMMDEVSFIAATRFTRMNVVTVSTDNIDFKKPIEHGSIIELIATVTYVGNTSLKVTVEVYKEKMYEEFRDLVISGVFSFVAVDENKKPTQIVMPD